jgi:hypothetical protein
LTRTSKTPANSSASTSAASASKRITGSAITGKIDPRHKHPVLGYPSKIAAIEALWDQGYHHSYIAAKIGASERTVRAMFSRLRARRRKANGEAARPPSPLVGVLIPRELFDAFKEPAAARGISVSALARNLLSIIHADSLIDSILDDQE